MSTGKSWIERLFSNEKRKGERKEEPHLVAYYWDGGAPTPHPIRDISATGFYLLTTARWHPGTMITMTLQKTNAMLAGPDDHITVLSKVVRLCDDGVAFVFVPQETQTSGQAEGSRGVPANRKALNRFVELLRSERD